MRQFKYFFSLLPGILAIIGNLVGSYFSAMGLIYSMLILVILDRLFSEDKEETNLAEQDAIADLVLILSSFIHLIAIATLLYGTYTHLLHGWVLAAAIVSTALNSGISGIITAHEMIHRKQSSWRFLGIVNLVFVNYSHFYIEHIKGHHKWVGTDRDPATARYGESIYQFVLRTVPGQFISAFRFESSRLQKLNKSAFSLHNFVLRGMLSQLVICLLVYNFLGASVLFSYLSQAVIAVFLLEYVNYIEHYGLVRKEDEKYNAKHAWQSDIPISRFSLIELSRHSDHHLKASKPYQTLNSLPESPVLPSGYFGVFYLVMIPPLWFKHVHPLLKRD